MGVGFSMSGLFDTAEVVRMSTFAGPEMIQERLQYTFVASHPRLESSRLPSWVELEERWPLALCRAMKETIRIELLRGIRDNYNTQVF